MALALTVGVLVAGGVFMILRRGMLRIIIGFLMLSHGVNLLLVLSGGSSRRTPAIGTDFDLTTTSDPLPQAFVLTAIVIAFAVIIFMLVLAVIGDGDDDTDLGDLPSDTTPDLFPHDHPAYRGEIEPEHWHDYVDRADDDPEDPDPGEHGERGDPGADTGRAEHTPTGAHAPHTTHTTTEETR